MDLDAIRQLIDTLIEKQIDEFELEEGDLRVRVRRGGAASAALAGAAMIVQPSLGVPAIAAATASAAGTPAAAEPAADENLFIVKSPIVGTYFESPAPGAPEFIQTGDRVEPGQVLCIIEAMKLMNEIECEQAGTVVRKLVTNGQPVEYGEPLMQIRLG